jgi:signal transduction histidine kinase
MRPLDASTGTNVSHGEYSTSIGEGTAGVPDTAAHEDQVRASVIVAIFGLSLFAIFGVLVRGTSVLSFQTWPVFGIAILLALVNVGLALWTGWWRLGPWVAWAYEGFHAFWFTVILYFLGGLQMSAWLPVYGFLVMHTEILRPDASVFVTANLCATLFAGLGVAEQTGLVTPPRVLDLELTGGQRLVFVGWAFLSLNFLALYANRYGHKLRSLAATLDRLVHQRTAGLQRANAELRQTATALRQKQAELEAFVYTVTHDLKNPLSSIVLTADMALQRDDEPLPPRARAAVERIRTSGQRSEDMIRDLLSLFRITSSPEHPAEIDLNALARQAVDDLRPQIGAKDARLDVEPLPTVWGQPRKLSHVFANVLENAVKYVPTGAGRIHVGARVENGAAIVCVRDNGVGIAPEYQARIFDVFGRVPDREQQVDGRSVGGSGVGLAIAKEIVAAHGGHIWVESSPGAGSAFYLRLPRRPAP